MRVKTLFSIILLCCVPSSVLAQNADSFVEELKSHYQDTLSIQSYTLQYHFLNSVYRDDHYWDYKSPNRHWSRRTVAVDMKNRQFYDNDTLYFTGGRVYDRVQFQSDTESFFYEKSASLLGRALVKRDMNNFDRFIKHQAMNIDFIAVRPLLREKDIQSTISVRPSEDDAITILSHTTAEGGEVTYTFQNSPLRLKSIDKGTRDGVFIYADYQTSDKFHFARSVYKYYDGAKEPSYISYNDHFDVIDSIAPYKLKVPEGYGPELVRGDGVLVAEEIADNLYLVTDSSAVRNALLHIVDDNIRVFGAAGNKEFADKTLALVDQYFPDKTVTSVYVTHPHTYQMAGLMPFVDRGIEVLADTYTIAAIQAAPRFSANIARFKFRALEAEQMESGVKFYVLENMLSKRQSFAYFENSGIIFQSSFLHIPFDNTIAKIVPTYSRAFIDFIRAKKLHVNRVVGNYRNNNISVEVMNKTYDAMM